MISGTSTFSHSNWIEYKDSSAHFEYTTTDRRKMLRNHLKHMI